MARTFPTDGVSPCDFYASVAPDRALGHFQWDLSGATAPAADGIIVIDINDATTISSGYINGLVLNYCGSGTKTGGEIRVLSSTVDIDANTVFATCIYAHTDAIANKTIDGLYGLWIDMNDPGTACNRYFGIHIDMDLDSVPLNQTGMLRFRNSGTRALNSIFQIEHTNPATYLLDLVGAGNPYVSQNAATADGSIRCRVHGTDKYIALYNTAT